MRTLISIFVITLACCITCACSEYDYKFAVVVTFLTYIAAQIMHRSGPEPMQKDYEAYKKAHGLK